MLHWLGVMICASSCRHPAVTAAAVSTGPAITAAATPDTNAAANAAFVAGVLKKIAGRETQRAESVFTNMKIPWLGATDAQTLLAIMNEGYAKALGVRCTYCHVVTDFSSDAKRTKRAAREMAVMHRMINNALQQMEHSATAVREDRYIVCATCHRGSPRPPRF